MAKITVKDAIIRTVKVNDIDYICITDIARQKNPLEPKDVVKNWLRSKNTLEYLGLWEMLNNPDFKGVEFDPLLSGESERCVHSEGYGTERAAYGTEQNCHSANEGSGSG